MSHIRASRIPIVERRADWKVCIRCGRDWRDSRYRYIDRAPCADCREIYEDEGVDIVAEFVNERTRQRERERETAA